MIRGLRVIHLAMRRQGKGYVLLMLENYISKKTLKLCFNDCWKITQKENEAILALDITQK